MKLTQTVARLKSTLCSNYKYVIIIAVSAGFARATYSIALILMNGVIPLISPITKSEVMKMNSYLLVLDFCALPFFGWVSSKFSIEKFMLFVALGIVLLSMPLLSFLEGAPVERIVGVRVVFVMFGVAFFAPFHAWVQQLVPNHSRYLIISLGYALGSQLLGSPTAAYSLWFFQKTGMISSIAWYWMFLGVMSSFFIAMTIRSTRSVSLDES